MIAIIKDEEVYVIDENRNEYLNINAHIRKMDVENYIYSMIKKKSNLLENPKPIQPQEYEAIAQLTDDYIDDFNSILNGKNNHSWKLFEDEQETQDDKKDSTFNKVLDKLDKLMGQVNTSKTSDYSNDLESIDRKLDSLLQQLNSNNNQTLETKIKRINDTVQNVNREIYGMRDGIDTTNKLVKSIPGRLSMIEEQLNKVSQPIEVEEEKEDIFEIKDNEDTQAMLEQMFKVSQELNLKILEAAKWYQTNEPQENEPQENEPEEEACQIVSERPKERLLKKGRKI